MPGLFIDKIYIDNLTLDFLSEAYLNYSNINKISDTIYKPSPGSVYIIEESHNDGYIYYSKHKEINSDAILIKIYRNKEITKTEYFYKEKFIVVHYKRAILTTLTDIIYERLRRRREMFSDIFKDVKCELVFEKDLCNIEELMKKYKGV